MSFLKKVVRGVNGALKFSSNQLHKVEGAGRGLGKIVTHAGKAAYGAVKHEVSKIGPEAGRVIDKGLESLATGLGLAGGAKLMDAIGLLGGEAASAGVGLMETAKAGGNNGLVALPKAVSKKAPPARGPFKTQQEYLKNPSLQNFINF